MKTPPELLRYARANRREMTRQERRLWHDLLRGYQPRFYRQRPMGGYILDFYCPAAKLCVELDGSQHYTDQGQAHDAERSEALARLGVRVLRFPNTDVERNLPGVAARIEQVLQGEGQP